MNVSGKKVLLTGATGGLGKSIALAYARGGAHVIAADLDDVQGAELERRGSDTPGSIRYVHLDLAKLDAGIDAVTDVDILINNAAIYPAKKLNEFDLEQYRAVQAVNVDAHVALTLAAVPRMKARGWGRIVNVASITFYGGWDRLFPYVASKGALIGLTRAWARELGPFGITVNAISPGAFPTDAEKIHPDPEGYTRFVLEHQSVKRRGNPEDVANAMLFLSSDSSSFISGQTLNVDGGWVMH